MKTSLDNQKLLDLINDARQGKLVLPQFQRNFVWSRDDITALLVSILEGHFIGSFLLLRTDSDNVPFAVRVLEGIKPSNLLMPEQMILDGQQRLTSLNYVFAAPNIPLRFTKYPYRFFLDLRQVTAKNFENAVISERSDQVGDMLERTRQFETLVVPFTEIENWNDWLNNYEQWLVERDREYYFHQYFKIDKQAWIEVMDRIRGYQVPTITIPKFNPDNPESLAEVCAIFEKMNSKGVRLSVYDLLTARLYKDGIDLHALWGEAVNKYELLYLYTDGSSEDFGVYVLRALALIRGLDVKSKTLINLSPVNFKTDWETATRFIEKALARMTSIGTDGFGAFEKKWLPYTTMVSTLAAMLHYIEKKKLDHRAYKLIQRWYWSSVFRERYAGSVESTVYRDYQDFIKASSDSAFKPEAVQDARVNIVENRAFSLLNVSRLNSVYRGVMCLVALRGAKDFRADDAIHFHTLEDHHIFPVDYLKKQSTLKGEKLSSNQINTIVNRTLISASTNKSISKSSPREYLQKVIPGDRTAEILASHFIDRQAVEAMCENDFEKFLKLRDSALIAEINKRIGG